MASESLTTMRPPEVSVVKGAGLPVASLAAHDAVTKIAGIKLDRTSEP